MIPLWLFTYRSHTLTSMCSYSFHTQASLSNHLTKLEYVCDIYNTTCSSVNFEYTPQISSPGVPHLMATTPFQLFKPKTKQNKKQTYKQKVEASLIILFLSDTRTSHPIHLEIHKLYFKVHPGFILFPATTAMTHSPHYDLSPVLL